METVKRLDEAGIVCMRIGQFLHQPTGKVRYALFEVFDCLVEVFMCRDRI